MILKPNSRVHIIGGGPAGSLFAIHLLREAESGGRPLQVSIIDQRFGQDTDCDPQCFTGCNLCAGVISPQLHKELNTLGIHIPGQVMCESFSHIWIHGSWKNFPLKVPKSQTLCSVFRGTLPKDRRDYRPGFDSFLMSTAKTLGVQPIAGTVESIRYTDRRTPVLGVQTHSGETQHIESDFICMATGVNAWHLPGQNRLLESYQSINPGFTPPDTRQTLIVEMKPGKPFLKTYMDRELYLIVSGSRTLLLEHAALVPKGDYLTIALVGKSIDRAIFPKDTRRVIQTFLSLPQVQTILPGMSLGNTPMTCMCNPQMSVGLSQSPFEDRIAVLGDALGARLYRDGLYSACISAGTLTRTVLHEGVDKQSLNRGFADLLNWLETDNRYCRLVFGLTQSILKSNLMCRIFYQTFASEMKFKTSESWPLGKILWNIGSGSADYAAVVKDLATLPVLRSFLTGTVKTFRNILTELFFGIRWGAFGRYPAVILKEKREVIKQSIEKAAGITLSPKPQMERMYAIKVRAPARAIYEELGRFGDIQSKFLRLRFVNVKRIKGLPNQVGAVVRYSARFPPIAMDVRLIRSIPDRVLLFEPQELFAQNGILLFDITPTTDGNNRLVIYTAFDYKTGHTPFQKLLFKALRHTFPDYAHDVVWNHAICSIKAQAEQVSRSVHQEKGFPGQLT